MDVIKWYWPLPGSFRVCWSLPLSPSISYSGVRSSELSDLFLGWLGCLNNQIIYHLHPRCLDLFIFSNHRSCAVGIAMPPFSIDLSWGYFWSGRGWTTVIYSVEYMLVLSALWRSYLIHSCLQHKLRIVYCKDSRVWYIPRKNIYDVHTDSYQTNRVTSPLDTACPAETTAPHRMGIPKTPLLGLADFTPCRSYSISGSWDLYPGHFRLLLLLLLLLLQPKTNSKSDSR